MSGQEWVAVIGAISAGVCAVLVGLVQLVVALRTTAKVDRVQAAVNGHTQAIVGLATAAVERLPAAAVSAEGPPKVEGIRPH